MADVFVSYSRQDAPFVTRLADAIESGGKQVWIDTAGIEDTEVFPLAIRSAIEASDAFLFVISPASIASRFCEQEVDYAHSLNKRLVPVLWIQVPDDELPEPMRERSWIPFEADTDLDGSLTRVLSALDADLEHRRSHTRWLTKAIEWDNERRERSLLLRGSELRTGEAWLASTTEQSDPAPTTLQREYLLASRQAAGRRSRVLVAGSLAVTLIAVGLLVFALISRGQAVHDQVEASAQALSVESQNDLGVDPEASVILATRAVREQATPQTMLALREALDASPLVASLPTVASPGLCFGPTPSVAFRPGTDEIAENACSGGIVLASVKSGKMIQKLSPITSGTDLAYNGKGTVLALGTGFGVSLLNPKSGAVTRSLITPGGGSAGSVMFNPSGTVVGATCIGPGFQSALFDVASGREIPLGGTNTSSPGYTYANNNSSLAFTPDGRFVIAGSDSAGATPVFNSAGAFVRALKTGPPSLKGFASFVATSPNLPLLAVAFNTDAGNGKVEIWSTRTWTEKFVLTTTSDVQYSSLAFSPDGTRLAPGETNGSAAVWSLLTGREIVRILGQTSTIEAIEFSPDGREVATASDDGTVRVWRASGPELDDLHTGGSIESLALSGSGVVAASVRGNTVEVSDLPTSGQAVAHSFPIPGSSRYDVVSVSPDGRYVADFANTPCSSGLCTTGSVSVYDVPSGDLYRIYPVAGAEAITWSHDDKELAVASEALEVIPLVGQAVAFNVQGAEECGTDGAPAFSADDSLVAWATACGNVAVFRLTGSGAPASVATFTAPGRPSALAFNPAGTQLAVSSSIGAVTIFNPRTGDRLRSLPTAAAGVTSIAYSPDGRYLVTTLLTSPSRSSSPQLTSWHGLTRTWHQYSWFPPSRPGKASSPRGIRPER